LTVPDALLLLGLLVLPVMWMHEAVVRSGSWQEL
jgi:hypothetical protein